MGHWFSKVVAGLLVSFLLSGLALTVMAQSNNLNLYLTEINSNSFPNLEALLAVTSPNGTPITDLQADQLQLQEDGVSVAGPVTTEAVLLDNLHLIVALDVSVSRADINQLKAAAQSLLAISPPFDCLSLVSFGDEVTRLSQCTNNTESLQSTLDALQPERDVTKLHEAIFETAEIIETEGEGRRAVILIADRHDNANTLPLSQAIERAEQAEVPFYVIGFGPEVQPGHSIKADIASTGGRYLTLASAAQVESQLQDIVTELQQGVKVSFQSMLPADNETHTLNINLTRPEGSDQAAGQFVATANQVSISLPAELSQLQIKGSMLLSPTITAPAPVAEVTYLLNGRQLSQQTTNPFAYTWDNTAIEPGQHTLTVSVVDEAGNAGQTETTLNLAKPLTIDSINLPTQIPHGQTFTVAITGPTGIQLDEVTLLVGSQPIAPINSPGSSGLFTFNVDTSSFAQGPHNIVLQATDVLGQSDEKSSTINFVLATPRTWLQVLSEMFGVTVATMIWAINLTVDILIILLALLVILLLLFVDWSIIRRIWYIHLQKARKRFVLDIDNGGNIESRYELWAEDPAKLLKFEFTLDGARLPHRLKEELVYEVPLKPTENNGRDKNLPTPSSVPGPARGRAEPAAGPTQSTPIIRRQNAQVAPQPTSSVVQPSTPASADPVQSQNPKQKTAKASNLGRKLKGLFTPLASALRVAGQLLGPFGGPLRQLSTSLTASQNMAQRVAQKPQQFANRSKQLGQHLGQIAPSGGSTSTTTSTTTSSSSSSSSSPAQATPARSAPPSLPQPEALPQPEPTTMPSPAPSPSTPVVSAPSPSPSQPTPTMAASSKSTPAKTKSRKRPRLRHHSIINPAQSPEIPAGRSLTVELWITPPHPYKPLNSPFTLYSQPVEPLNPLVDQQGLADIRGLRGFQRWWPLTTVSLITLLLILGTTYLAYWAIVNVNFLELLLL